MDIFNLKVRLDRKFLQFDIPKIKRTANLHLMPSLNLPEKSVDMVTALSVCTHFREEDARFYFMEESLRDTGRDISKTPLEELELLWEKAKASET